MKIKETIKTAFTPNQELDKRPLKFMVLTQLLLLLLLWTFSHNSVIPNPFDVSVAVFKLIVSGGLARDFLISLTLCLKGLAYAVIISLFFGYLSVLPFFRPFSNLLTKFRFLPTVGLGFLFLKLAPDVEGQKTLFLTYSITVFFLTSVMAIINSVTSDELNYARTLRMSEWRAFIEVIVFGKAHEIWDAIGQVFAIAYMMIASVENLCKSDGGIGVILSDNNKHFNFDEVYAVQICILLTGIAADLAIRKAKGFIFPYSILTLERK